MHNYNQQRIRAYRLKHQLKILADQIPDIRWLGLVAMDGLSMGFYNKNHYTQIPTTPSEIITPSGERILIEEEQHEEADRVSPLSAAVLSLTERITAEIGTGEWESTVITGKRAKYIALAINEKIFLVAMIEPSASIEAMLIELKSIYGRLVFDAE